MFDFPTTPAVGTIVQVPDGSWRRWDGVKWGPTPGPGPQALQVFIGDAPPGPPGGPLHGELWFNSYEQQMYIWYDDPNSSQWVIVTANVGGISADAPFDGHLYGRQNGAWSAVDTEGKFLPLIGGNMLGPIDMGNNLINNLADAASPTDAMNQRSSDARYLMSQLWNAGSVTATGPNLKNTAGTLDLAPSISIGGSAAAGALFLNTGTPVASEILSVNGAFNMGGTLGLGGTINTTMGVNMAVVNGGLPVGGFPPTSGSTALWVVGSGLTRIMIEGVGNTPALTMRSALGTAAAPLPVTNNVNLGSVLGMGYDGAAYSGAQAGWYMNALGSWSGTNRGVVHLWLATKSNTTANVEQMRLTNGHLLINQTADDTINFLQVNGPITAPFHAEGVSNALTLTGTTQATALALTRGLNLFGTVPATSGALLPQIGLAVTAGTWVECFNTTATAARIYATSPQTIDGVATATGVPLSAGARCRYFANTGSTWVSALMGGVSA